MIRGPRPPHHKQSTLDRITLGGEDTTPRMAVWVVLVASPTPVLRFILIVMATDQIPLKATVLDLFGFGLKTSPLNIHEMIFFFFF